MADETNPYIYVIEDEEAISQLICMYLNKSDMTASPFYNRAFHDPRYHQRQPVETLRTVWERW